MRGYDVDFFIRENGDCPVKEFLLSLDKKMRAKLLVELDLLEENGPQLREPYSKHLEDGIFELRAKQGSDITRVLYFFFVGKKIVLTNGFTKKTQKTPRAEIATAKKYRAEYIERKESLSCVILENSLMNSLRTRSSRLNGMLCSRNAHWFRP